MQVSVPRIGSARVCVPILSRNILPLALVSLALLAALGACSKPPSEAPASTSAAPKTTGLESIPPGDPKKYPPFQDMRGWMNPYFVVRDDGIGFVDLSNREVHILTPEQIPARSEEH